jgi:HYDIN/CFA65/VesB family protein
MPKLTTAPFPIGVVALALLLLSLVAAPAALAAPEEGSGTLSAEPSPIVLPPTTVGTQSPMRTVTLEYQGSGEVNVQKLAIEGPEAGEFVLGGSNCNNLTAGQKCEAWIALEPGPVGFKQATLKVIFVGLHPEESFEISGRGVAAQISLDPTSYDFGLLRANRENVSTTFQLTNDGEAEVQLGSLEISGDSNVFGTGWSSCWGTWLAPGQSCAIEVHFGPQESRTYSAELRAGANGATATAALSGEGGRAIIEPPAQPVDFGAASAGSPGAVRTITLQNTGNVAEAFFIGIVAGGDSGSFRLLEESCSGHELAPLDTCTATVRFEPIGPGPKAAHLAFFGDGEGGVVIDLEAEGVAAAAQLGPASFDFGSLPVGARSPGREFVVRNEGLTALQLDRVAIVGADVGQFGLSGDLCTGAILAPGEECGVVVRFIPGDAGAFAATLRVSGPAGVLTAQLSGQGLASGGSAAVPGSGTSGGSPGPELAGAVLPVTTAKRRPHRRFGRNATIVAPAARSSRLEPRHGRGERRSPLID